MRVCKYFLCVCGLIALASGAPKLRKRIAAISAKASQAKHAKPSEPTEHFQSCIGAPIPRYRTSASSKPSTRAPDDDSDGDALAKFLQTLHRQGILSTSQVQQGASSAIKTLGGASKIDVARVREAGGVWKLTTKYFKRFPSLHEEIQSDATVVQSIDSIVGQKVAQTSIWRRLFFITT